MHREGRIGDFARAGLLFLFDIAFLSPEEEGGDNLQSRPQGDGSEPLRDAREALAEYMLDGDFADVMAATLGAVYSVLPTKLRVASAFELPSSRDEGDDEAGSRPSSAEEGQAIPLSTDDNVRTQLDHFLKLVGFLQDITRRCSSSSLKAQIDTSRLSPLGSAVSNSVIDAMRTSFLDNILYPSILESSPVDGTSVAVMTYLGVVLSNLDDGPLLTALLEYLLADTDRFSMKDLVLENIESGSSSASAAALRLAGTLLKEHCAAATRGLLQVKVETDPRLPRRSNESSLYSALLRRIDPRQSSMSSTTGYSAYIADATNSIHQDQCCDTGHPHVVGSSMADYNPQVSQSTPAHALDPDDALSRGVFALLGDFLAKPSEENVALTGFVSALAQCPQRSLSGWLVDDSIPDSKDAQNPELAENKDADESDDEFAARCRTTQSSGDPFLDTPAALQPVVYQILRDITNQISRVRAQTRDFERLLEDRRRQLLSSSNVEEDVAPDHEGSAGQATRGSPLPATPPRGGTAVSPAPKRAMISPFGSLRNFFSPQKKTPSGDPRPASPKSRSSSAAVDSASTPPRLGTPVGGKEPGPGDTVRLDSSTPKITGPWAAESAAFLTPDRRTSSAQAARDRPDTPMSDTSLQRTGPRPPPKSRSNDPTTVKLDQVLDNCIIMEEFIKEIVAIINARRALGIDPVGYS